MIIILVLAFMNKRVNLKLDLLNGRPGLPIVVDFLGKERNRFIIVMAFGATASTCFRMFFETFFKLNATGVSKYMPSSPYAKAFQGFLLTLVYGINNYPYLACLHVQYKAIGYTIGFVYAFIRCIVDLFLYLGCFISAEFKMGILIYVPPLICTILLCGSYALLLFTHLKENYYSHEVCCNILMKATVQNEPVAENIDKIHVKMLLENRLHKRLSISRENEPWYISLRRKIYTTRPDFKFSTQFLSAVFVSFIFVYQLTISLLLVIVLIKKMYQINYVLLVLFDYVIAAVLLSAIVAVVQLLMFVQSHRDDVLKIYRSRKGLLQDEYIKPKTLVGKCLRFCGYQVGFTAVGYLVLFLSILFLISPIWVCQYFDMVEGRDFLLLQLKKIFLAVLPIVLYPLLIWLSVVLLSIFVFRDNNYPDLTVTIDNRRLYDNVSYFYFFLNILVGLWSGLFRVVKGAALGVVFLCRLDRTSMTTGYKKWDRGFTAYIGFLNVLAAFRHPVMLCFCQILIDERQKVFQPFPPSERPRVSTRALNRWFLATMLLRNPSLLRYRKKNYRDVSFRNSPESADNEYVTLEEVQIPVERLKSVHVY